MIGKAIYDRLTSTVDVAALVGTRVFPELAPDQKVYPVIVYDVTNADLEATYADAVDLRPYSVTLFCIAQTYSQAQDLASKVVIAIDHQSGTWGGIDIDAAFVEDQSDDTITIADDSEARFALVEVETLIWARTAV